MAIGTSMGAFFPDLFDFHQKDGKMDEDNTIDWTQNDKMEVTPNQMFENQQMDKIEETELGGIQIKYDTKLTPAEEKTYKERYGEDADRDYDMRGYFKANPDVLPNQEGVHYPDTFKKPNHPTFSDESIYNGVDGNIGGHWDEQDGKTSFTPGKTNLENWGREGLKDYFNRVEPDVELR